MASDWNKIRRYVSLTLRSSGVSYPELRCFIGDASADAINEVLP